MIIAIDGPAGSGKGTLSRGLAKRFNLAYLDTGLLYRVVGLSVLRNPDISIISIIQNLDLTALTDPTLRSEDVGKIASEVAVLPDVRAKLLKSQRIFALCPPPGMDGTILDGRDIGTVVFQDADYKLFITANLEVRSYRRVKELQKQGIEATEKQVLEQIYLRDYYDSGRSIAPLYPAVDAFILDTSKMSPATVLTLATAYILSCNKRQDELSAILEAR